MRHLAVYLDYAAATPLDKRVETAMRPLSKTVFHNPSALYRAGREAKKILEEGARAEVAKLVGARAGEVVFTAGGSEANNLAIQGVMRQWPDGEVIVSAVEHESVIRPAGLFSNKSLPVTSEGYAREDVLKKLVTPKTVLVCVMLVNNEIGALQPLRKISRLLAEERKRRRQAGENRPLWLHADACQAANYFDLNIHRLGADLMSLNGGKIYGPKQTGALVVRAGVKLRPLILGGGQEFNLRSGTENVAGAVGFATALGLAQAGRRAESQRLAQLRDQFIKSISQRVPAARLNGPVGRRSPNNAHFTFPGQDNERLLFALDERGIQAATGSACSAAKQDISHVLLATGLSEAEARASLRFTFGRQTTKRDIKLAAQVVSELVTS